ncbi:phosphoadenosine phosphosulfate reductase family protein [Luteolibacter yonseiensis]|uniref:Phosphoadenosine phosphosulfate reductase family protein n=1 Tax=Luteolibacter yonseiensis TaxID=1144680 RepID=A0A934VBP8_9BACT|nr:phosphoadenosine phosphosulfate reductase family protein [Luteolibacter yonseiensis]MBK1817508.1 phosphoadenosine phosphosulfate reductase family protein [Luteolibacter yonseiensis]
MKPSQPTLFDGDRMDLSDAIEITANSLRAYAERYNYWAIAFSGGKDSSALLTVVAYLIASGRVPRPKKLIVLYADTRMELPPLHATAMILLEEVRALGVETRIVLPELDDRFFVYMLGRGVPPPSNTFRWCTAQIKIEPMLAALKSLRDEAGEKFLMLTGVRLGESAVRDARIALSCSKNGAECGQGWFQEATPESVADTLAPILHWRVCLVWDWLMEADLTDKFGFHFSTKLVAHCYGGDEAVEINARTGCVGCNLASRDVALERVLQYPQWKHLQPLMELRPLYAEMKLPKNRLRKDGTEARRDGTLVSKPCRMSPLTLEARMEFLDRLLSIQKRASVDLINSVEEVRIRELIAAQTWPRGWKGSEQLASIPFANVNPDGSVQPNLEGIL